MTTDRPVVRLRRLFYRLRYGPPEAMDRRRADLATRYLSGDGIEIGALHNPLPLPAGARARYLDRFPVDELRAHYPEMEDRKLIPVDVLDDGETLATVAGGTVDFLIANHVIEHCEDPIGALGHWLRVLRPGGHLFLAVPDKRISFDHRRHLTRLEHLLRDRHQGPELSRRGHYTEWAAHVEGIPPPNVPARAAELEQARYSIHFHVWTPRSFRRFLRLCREQLDIPFDITAQVRNSLETLVVLRRGS